MIVVLLMANIAVFLLMAVRTGTVGFTSGTLYDWGGNLGLASLHGEPWRLLTATFLHANLQHIVGNMVLLLVTGGFIERKIGSLQFTGIYLASGIAASLLSAWARPEVVSIGASGAIAGLLGAMVTLKALRRAPEVSGAWMAQVIGFNALYSFAPNVDGFAHGGGFVAGLLLGLGAAVRLPTPLPETHEAD